MNFNIEYTNFTPEYGIIYFVRLKYLGVEQEEVFSLYQQERIFKKVNIKGVKLKTINLEIELIKIIGTHGNYGKITTTIHALKE